MGVREPGHLEAPWTSGMSPAQARLVTPGAGTPAAGPGWGSLGGARGNPPAASPGCGCLQVSLLEEQEQRVGGVHDVHAEAPVHRERPPVRAAPAQLHLVSAVGSRRVRGGARLWRGPLWGVSGVS